MCIFKNSHVENNCLWNVYCLYTMGSRLNQMQIYFHYSYFMVWLTITYEKLGVFFCERKYMSGILLMSWYFFSLNAHFGHIIYNIAIEFRYRNQMFIKLSFTAEFKRERANDDDACPFHQFVRTTNLLRGLLSNSSCYCTFITSFSAKRGHNGLKSFSNVD